MEAKQQEVQNQKRRTVLALGFTGVVTFVLGKLFGSDIMSLFGVEEVVSKREFSNFELKETKDEMILSDKRGDPIFIIDKTSFKE